MLNYYGDCLMAYSYMKRLHKVKPEDFDLERDILLLFISYKFLEIKIQLLHITVVTYNWFNLVFPDYGNNLS